MMQHTIWLSSSKFFVSHSQIMNAFHPDFSRLKIFSWSRSTVRCRLDDQNSIFVFGWTEPYLQECECQKHPWINTTIWYFGKTMSGFPGRSFLCSRYRYPCVWNALRVAISGFVSVDLIRAILRLRCSGVCTSVIAASISAALEFESLSLHDLKHSELPLLFFL